MLSSSKFMKNVSEDEQTSKKWEGARDSVMTIMFDNFGGGPYRSYEDASSGFNVHEKIRLAEGMRATAESSRLMQEAAQSNFYDYRGILKKWFGLDPTHFDFNAGVKFVVDGVNRMHRVLSDNTKQIRFIDARNQKRVFCTIEYEMLVSLNSANVFWERREKALVNDEYTEYNTEYFAGHVLSLSRAFRDEGNTAHVGSGYRVYVCEALLDATANQWSICRGIYHEMSHKILGTKDRNAKGENVYGYEDSQALAKESRYQALKIADCWTYFLMEFYHP